MSKTKRVAAVLLVVMLLASIAPSALAAKAFVTTLDGRSVGDIVEYTGDVHYVTANSAKGYKCYPGVAKITAIFSDSLHPFHLVTIGGSSNVHGWVDGNKIVNKGTNTSFAFAKGDIVEVKDGARTYEGLRLRPFVFELQYKVMDIYGDRVIIGRGGVVTAPMKAADLFISTAPVDPAV